ncbi:unnamed protein product [Coregonus sp. 'balchen']|nr:unnamed protein product [Coregonus sp. 'balchen']
MSKLPDSIDVGDFSMDNMTAPTFPDKMSPVKAALTLKDYENQIMTLKKENFNLKLRIYFMEERMQQKCDDSTEDIYKTNIELKVEVESMKRDLAEKHELLVSASKALESLAGRESGDSLRVRERAHREMDALRDTLNKRVAELEQGLRAAEEEVDKMAAIAEQEKVRSIGMEKQLLALGLSGTFTPIHVPSHDLQQALQEKNGVIDQLMISVVNQEAVIQRLQSTGRDQGTDAPTTEHIRQLSAIIGQKDEELQTLRAELGGEKGRTERDHQVITMKDPCRVCGVRLIGSQCRWIFNPSGKRQLQVILSHVLGRQVDRDPDGQASEFLCGKCVFKLERVVQCDVQIGRLQEEHAAQVQRLQQERENLKQCVAHVYGRHNPLPERPDVGEVSTVMTPLWRSSEGGSPDECGGGQLTSEGQRKEDGGEGDGRVRHSVSMDLLGGPGGPVGAAGRSSSALRRVQSSGDPCPACPVKNPGLQSARLRSRSMMYLDLVYRKGTLSGSRLRSASLQSLNPDHPHQTEPLGPLSQRLCRESKISVREHSHSVDHATTITTRLQRGHSPAQPPISDLLLLLRSIPRNPIPGTPGSRIPVLWRRPRVGQPLSPGRSITPGARRKEAEWKSLQDVTEEFNDGYMPLRAEGFTEQLNEVSRLETAQRQLSEEMNQFRATNQNLSKTLEDIQNNNKIEELCHEIEDRDEALAKAREAAHKAQLQKYQARCGGAPVSADGEAGGAVPAPGGAPHQAAGGPEAAALPGQEGAGAG